jgi:hypothetical protein
MNIIISKIPHFDEKDYSMFIFQLKQALQSKRAAYLLDIPSSAPLAEILIEVTKVTYKE